MGYGVNAKCSNFLGKNYGGVQAWISKGRGSRATPGGGDPATGDCAGVKFCRQLLLITLQLKLPTGFSPKQRLFFKITGFPGDFLLYGRTIPLTPVMRA
jgi:hypothetical protein